MLNTQLIADAVTADAVAAVANADADADVVRILPQPMLANAVAADADDAVTADADDAVPS
jgi:hypothetical protein